MKHKHDKYSTRANAGKENVNGNLFAPIRYDMLNSREFKELSLKAKALLIAGLAQYQHGKRGANNGNITFAHSVMEEWGFTRSTLRRALHELLDAQFIVRTKTGGFGNPHLYAFTFLRIDECKRNGRPIHDYEPTRRAPDLWKRYHEEDTTKLIDPDQEKDG